MRSARCSTRSRRTLLSAVSVFFVLQAIVAAYVLSDPELPREDLWQRRVRRFHQRSPSPDELIVVQIGSSRTEMGVRGAEAEPWLSDRLGRPVRLFNLGSLGAGPAANRLNLQRWLNDGVRAKLLLLEVLPRALSEDFVQAELRSDRLPAGELRFSETALVARLVGGQRPCLRAEWLVEQAVASGTYRTALLSRAYPRLLNADNRRDGFRGADESGYVPPTPRTPDQAARALQFAREEYQPVLACFRLSQRQLDLVGETVEEARGEGMAVALVLMPEGPTFRTWYPAETWSAILTALEQLSRQHSVPLINLREALDEEDFFDSHHATRDGAARLTRELAHRIEPLLQELNAAR